MKKTHPGAVAAPAATHMREIPFAIAVAMRTPASARTSPAAVAEHFRQTRVACRMPPL